MFSKRRTSKFRHPCRHCGKNHDSTYMADICFMLDMKLEKPKKDERKNKKNAG
jgi:hypothetical protein